MKILKVLSTIILIIYFLLIWYVCYSDKGINVLESLIIVATILIPLIYVIMS